MHTPGPWRIAGKGTIRVGDGWIANVHWRNREANASLIAAAPDLLDALKDMRKFFDGWKGHTVAKAEAAIAKAEGKQP